jgi:serine/threonine-protein kinase BUR1
MVFPYMDHDLSGLLDNERVVWTAPMIKLYAKQLLKGTAYLHKVRLGTPRLRPAHLADCPSKRSLPYPSAR